MRKKCTLYTGKYGKWTKYDLSRAPEFGCHGNRLINYQNLTTPNCFQVNLRKSHKVVDVDAIVRE